MEEQVLSIEQMKHLEELGFDTSDASMLYNRIDKDPRLICADFNINWKQVKLNNEPILPTYTLTDILKKLPKRIVTHHDNLVEMDTVCKLRLYFDDDDYCFAYEYSISDDKGCDTKYWYFNTVNQKDILQGAYETLLWCINNNYIK